MKSYIVDRSGLTPQLNEMPTNVEKIYPTKADAEAALANGDIADGEFVSTVDTVADTGDKFDKSYLSYSTEETLTGGTWIDGKPMYKITKPLETTGNMTAGTWYRALSNVDFDSIINVWVVDVSSTGTRFIFSGIFGAVGRTANNFDIMPTGQGVSAVVSGTTRYVIAEYTKQ